MDSFDTRLADALDEHGLTVTSLAKKVPISRQYLSRCFAEGQMPLVTYLRVCDILGWDPKETITTESWLTE